MRLKLLLPIVEPTKFKKPRECTRIGCKGKRFHPRQEVSKQIVDAKYRAVQVWRYECRKCGRTFRVYPQGVGKKQVSQRVSGLAVMLYVLGLSYGAVAIVMDALGMGIGKTSVYRTVQAAAEKVPGMKQQRLLDGYRTKAVGADITSVKCNGKWIPIANTDALVDELSAILRTGQDPPLEAIGVTSEQALEDLATLKTLIHSRRPEDQPCLEHLYERYANARKPGQGKKHDVVFRMRNLFLDRWNLWPRLTFYRTWKDEYENLILDGANNHCERSIGWWVKERYRPIRGYKSELSALNVSRLIAFAGNHLSRGLDLASLIA